MNKKRLQAASHYCEHKRFAVFGQNANSEQDVIRLMTNRLVKTSSGSFVFSFLKRIMAFVLRLVPCGGIFHARYFPNNSVGIFITTSCNVSCCNCQTSAGQAPANDIMTVEQIEKFVSEAIKLEYYWERMTLTGGEPTLHPNFFEIISVIKQYKDFNPECDIVLETNGTVQSVLDKVPGWIEVRNTSKREGENYLFFPYNFAPCDTLEYAFFPDFSKGCSLMAICYGLCISMYGYYPCSPCANVDRVFGFDIGIKKLEFVTERALREQMKILCKYCGFFRELTNKTVLTERISRSWRRAFVKYKEQKPSLSPYI